MSDFRNLKVWDRAHSLCLALYGLTAEFPQGAGQDVATRIRTLAAQVPAHIARGCAERQPRNLVAWLELAQTDLAALEYELVLARDLKLIPGLTYERLLEALSRVQELVLRFMNSTGVEP